MSENFRSHDKSMSPESGSHEIHFAEGVMNGSVDAVIGLKGIKELGNTLKALLGSPEKE